MTKDIRAASYFRDSTGKQEASLPEQREWADRVCPSNNVRIVRAFEDHAISGSEIENRPGLMAMVAFCEKAKASRQPIEAVVTWDLDRFSRATSIRTAAVLDKLMAAGVSRILTNDGWVDLEADMDVLLLNIKQDIGRAGYSKSLSKNVTRSAAERAFKGYHVAGRPPYGYSARFVAGMVNGRDGQRCHGLEIGDEGEAETVRWMFREYATTAVSLSGLVRKLREMGAPPPRARRESRSGGRVGGRWTRSAVYTILKRRVYLGEKTWGEVRQGKYHEHDGNEVRAVRGSGGRRRRAQAPPDQRIVVKGAHPALIDEDTFDRVQAKLAASRFKTTPIRGGGEWVLSGLLYCGHCGCRFIGQTRRKRCGQKQLVYRRYMCPGKYTLGADVCDSHAADQEVILRHIAKIVQEAFTGEHLERLRAAIEARLSRGSAESAKEKQRMTDRIAALDRDIAAGNERLLLCPADLMHGVAEALRKLQAERAEAARILEGLNAAADLVQEQSEAVSEAIAELQHLESWIAEAPVEKARTLVSRYVEKVTLHFLPPKVFASGRRRHVLDTDRIEIAFTPFVSYLFSSGSSSGSGRCA